MSNFVKCSCQHCRENIEFDSTQLSPENNVVPCPHCGQLTKLYAPVFPLKNIACDSSVVTKEETSTNNEQTPICLTRSDVLQKQAGESTASGYQTAILRSLEICDKQFLALVGESQAARLIEDSKLFKELVRKLKIDGILRQRIPADIEKKLLVFTIAKTSSETSFLEHIRSHFPEILLTQNYGKKKSRENRNYRQMAQEGEFAPTIEVTQIPPRSSGDPDATPAQKRFLRDLGVRDENLLADLGKSVASDLIEKVLDMRNKRFSS